MIPLMGTLGKDGLFPGDSGDLVKPVLALTFPIILFPLLILPVLFRNAVFADNLPAILTSLPLHPRYLGSAPSPILPAGPPSCCASSASEDHVDGGTVTQCGSHTVLQWAQS